MTDRDTGNDAQRAATQQSEQTKCPTCGSDKRSWLNPKCVDLYVHDGDSVDPWHRQPAAPETAETSTLINDSRIKHSPLFCGSRYCAQHRDIWHHFETVISRDSAGTPEGETDVETNSAVVGDSGILPSGVPNRSVLETSEAVASPAVSAEELFDDLRHRWMLANVDRQGFVERVNSWAAALTAERDAELLDAAMIIRRLCHRLQKSDRPGDQTIVFESIDWLKRNNLMGSVARAALTSTTPQEGK